MKRNYWPLVVRILSGIAIQVPMWSTAATTNEVASGDVQPALEEIIVTAQYRNENAQSVPISMSVLSASSLQGIGITEVASLPQAVPGLVLNQVAGTAQPFIRGVGSSSDSEFSGSDISVYVDGIYLPSLGQMFRQLADIERVEVLKGPQGILYGRNSPGGAINIITRDPTSETVAQFSATLGDYGRQEYSAFVSGGTDQLSESFSFFSTRRDGYTKNFAATVAPGIDPGFSDALSSEDVQGGRVKVKYTLNDAWSFLFAADYTYLHDTTGFGWVNYGVRPLGADMGGHYSDGPYSTYLNQPGFNIDNDRGESLTVRGDLPGMKFVSISSYRTYGKEYATDLDNTDLSLAYTQARYNSQTLTQEFRLLSNSASPLQWIAGTYFLHQVEGNPTQLSVPPLPQIVIEGADSTRSIAFFGQASYSLTENWKVTAGARYTDDQKNLTESSEALGATTVIVNPLGDKTWINTSPKVGIEYQRVGTLLYASATQGYRAGNYNLASPGDPGPVNPEKITAYEIGGKHDLIENALRVNWATYLYNFRDLQVDVVDQSSGVTKTENAANSKSYGADLDMTAAIASGLSATVSLDYLHARYTSFNNASLSVPNYVNGGNLAVVGNATGNVVTRSPEESASFQLQYVRPIEWGKLQFNAGYTFDSAYYLDIGNTIRQPAYGIVNLRAAFTTANGHWTTALFCDNASNKVSLEGAVQDAYANLVQYAPPRMYGVNFLYKY